jgi:hypothetical protein
VANSEKLSSLIGTQNRETKEQSRSHKLEKQTKACFGRVSLKCACKILKYITVVLILEL